MSERELNLVQRAIEKHNKIFPCGNTVLLKDCFTLAEDNLCFWFNTEDNTTHIVEEEM